MIFILIKPVTVKDVVDDIVDENWGLIEAKVMDGIGAGELKEENIMEHPEVHCCQKINPWYYLKKWYLYSV